MIISGETAMKTRHIAGIAAFAVALLVLGSPAWAEEDPDRIPWRTDTEAALEEANEKGTPVIINFTTPFGTG
jgi:hypothetical protein